MVYYRSAEVLSVGWRIWICSTAWGVGAVVFFFLSLEYLGGPEKTTGKGENMSDAMHQEEEPDLRAGSVALTVNLWR